MPSIIASTTSRILGTNDTRIVVGALAQIAPSLGDLGVGGIFSTESDSSGPSYIIFVLPNGTLADLTKGGLALAYTVGQHAEGSFIATASFFENTTKVWDNVHNNTYLVSLSSSWMTTGN